MNTSQLKKVGRWFGFMFAGALALAAIACGEEGSSSTPEMALSTRSALSTAQCQYFETNGNTTICHATSSLQNPYVLIRVSETACVNAHASHPRDFIDVSGGSCNNAACLPVTAPCDPTLPCCGNLNCQGGACACPSGQTFCDVTCVNLTSDPNNCGGCGAICATGTICIKGACVNPCVAIDQCHVAGTPDRVTGVCSNPPAMDGTGCNDGNACTRTDACRAGACVGSNPIVCTATDACHAAGTCDPVSGGCSNPNQPDGTGCNDGQPCTKADQCTGGVCAGTAYTCVPGDCQTGGTCNGDGTCSGFAETADGTTCTGGLCQSGVCQAGCTLLCGSACVDTRSDPLNCGACGALCTGSNETCSGGVCGCQPFAPTHCPGACVNLASDPSNCGSCGNACAPTQTCNNGVCQLFCPSGSSDCGSGTCQDVLSDDSHCGGCNHACPTGFKCIGGICNGCPTYQVFCGNTCTSLFTDPHNCGSCGNQCAAPTPCTGGVCQCPIGQGLCGTGCVDLMTDRQNCGSCGNVCPAPSDSLCAHGQCGSCEGTNGSCRSSGECCSGLCESPFGGSVGPGQTGTCF